MARFYFDLKNGQQIIRDDEGVKANGHEEAISEAKSALREMPGNDELHGQRLGWQLIIRDQSWLTIGVMSLDGNSFSQPASSVLEVQLLAS